MRKLFLVVLLTTLLLGVMMVPAHAAEAIVSTDLWADIFGTYNATYESTLSLLPDNMTFYATASYFNYGYLGWTISGFGIGGGVNYYFGDIFGIPGDTMEGLYASGGLWYEMFSDTWSGVDLPAFGISLGVGYKWYLNDKWVLDGRCGFGGIYGGIGYVLK